MTSAKKGFLACLEFLLGFHIQWVSGGRVAINRTPHYDVWSARPHAVNIGDLRIPHLHPHAQHQKFVVLDTLFSA